VLTQGVGTRMQEPGCQVPRGRCRWWEGEGRRRRGGGARAGDERATESEGEGKQTPPLAFGAGEGFGSMRKKKPPPARV
jgi:hypothetical protein